MNPIEMDSEARNSAVVADGARPASSSPLPDAPKKLRQDFLLRWLTYLVLIPLAAAATAAFGTAAIIASLFDSTGRLQHSIAHHWAGALLRIAHSPVTMINGEQLANMSPAVYVVNHLSYMDTPVLFSKLPFQFRILARHELLKLPFIGWYLQRSGQVPVDSSNLRSTLASLNRGVRILQAGMPLVIFPEGGRALDGKLQPFLSGPAFMAIRAGVPIVPMALIGTYEVMPMHTYHLHPRPLTLVVGQPIMTAEYTSKMADELTRLVYQTIHDMYMLHSHDDTSSDMRSSE